MKILVVQPNFAVYGGAELVIIRLCNYLSSKNIENTLISNNILPDIRRDLKSTEIIISNDIIKYIKENLDVYDLINLHNHPAELFLYPQKKKSIWNCNEPATPILMGQSPPEEWIKAVQEINKIIVSDQFNKERIEKVYKVKNCIINRYGIDYDFWSPKLNKEELRSKYNLDGFIIIHIGWFNEFKNQIQTLKAINSLKNIMPDIKVIFAGFNKTPLALDCMKYAIDNNLENNVIFTGHINRRTLREYVSCSDLAVFPFLKQGGWLSPFETLSAGVPVIASSEILCADLIRDNDLGEISDNLEKSILSFRAKNKDILLDKVKKAKDYISKNMTWEQYCENELNIFKEILQ